MNFINIQKDGWTFDGDFAMDKKLPDGKEVSIEFCIGDFCVGLYSQDKELIQGKYRCLTLFEAITKGNEIISLLESR